MNIYIIIITALIICLCLTFSYSKRNKKKYCEEIKKMTKDYKEGMRKIKEMNDYIDKR